MTTAHLGAGETLPLAAAKARLSELIQRVSGTHERITITVHGQPSAVLVDPADLEGLEETIAWLSVPRAQERLAETQRDLADGNLVTEEEMHAEMVRLGRVKK